MAFLEQEEILLKASKHTLNEKNIYDTIRLKKSITKDKIYTGNFKYNIFVVRSTGKYLTKTICCS